MSEDEIGDLIRLVRHRPSPPAASTARVRASVEAAWRESLPAVQRSRRRFLAVAAAAAAVVIVSVVRAIWWPAAVPALPVATAVRVSGSVRVAVVNNVAAGDRLVAGNAIETGPGASVVFDLDTGASIRVDGGSRVTIESTAQLALDRGRLYVSSDRTADPRRAVVISTSFGAVREIGTQFEVSAEPSSLRVRVRRGVVQIDRSDAPVVTPEGHAVRIDAGGRVDRTAIAVDGAEWSWVDALAPPIVIEGATLERFLVWVSRELDVRWQYADAAAERHGRTVVLHGSIEGLTPREALDAVLATCGMRQSRRGEQLFIEKE